MIMTGIRSIAKSAPLGAVGRSGRGLALAGIAVLSLLLGACTAEDIDRMNEALRERQENDPRNRPVAMYDPTGYWCFTDYRNGSRNRNYLEATGDGMIASPVGRGGRQAYYYRVREGVYQDRDGPGVYTFTGTNSGYWRSGNVNFDLTRC
jgi:hypothetical protein